MIVTSLDGSLPFYRAHTPRWSAEPLSGAGAGKVGGRLNRRGVDALYLSASTETAINEYQQLSPLLPPCTLAQYRVVLASVVDFRGGFDATHWPLLWRDLYCDHRHLANIEHVEPPSWILGDEVIAAGHAGVLFKSARGSGVNLVVYTAAVKPPDRLEVIDPDGKLPRSGESWK